MSKQSQDILHGRISLTPSSMRPVNKTVPVQEVPVVHVATETNSNTRSYTMKTEIKKIDGVDTLIITIPMQKPTASQSGKTLVVASTHGNQGTTVQVDGKPVILGLNAYIKA